MREPSLARWILGFVTPAEERPYLLADLEESYDARVEREGRAAARRWYWHQTIMSVVPLLGRRFSRRSAMSRGTPRSWWLWELRADVRLALRRIRCAPGMAVAVIATMAIGIGATTALYSVLSAVLLEPLPFEASERAVRLGMVTRAGDLSSNVAHADFEDYRRDVRAFAALAGFDVTTATLRTGGDPDVLRVARVDSAYATVLHLTAARGRLFHGEDYLPGRHRVVVLTHGIWQSRFGGDPDIVGRTVELDLFDGGGEGEIAPSWVVAGVLPSGAYLYPERGIGALVPLVVPENSWMRNRGAMWMNAIGLLRGTATLEAGSAEVAEVGRRLEREFPDANGGIVPRLESLRDVVSGPVRDMLLLLTAAVAAVLLIACANVGNLLLGQTYGRTRELTVRAALGGAGWRIQRQLLTESLVLATFGGLLGLLLAPLLTRTLLALYPGTLPRLDAIRIDGQVLALSCLATIGAGLLAGVPIALRSTRLDLSRDLRDAQRTTGTRSQRRVSSALVVSQIAVTLVLLSAGGLLLRTFVALTRVEPGFDARGVLTFMVSAPASRYAVWQDVQRFFGELEAGLAALPEVDGVASTTSLPFGGSWQRDVFERAEIGNQGAQNPWAYVRTVSPDYHGVMGIPIVRGRGLEAHSAAAREVVISEALASRTWGDEDPIGRFIRWQGAENWQVVGISGAVRDGNPGQEAVPELFALSGGRTRHVVIRSRAATEALLPGVRATVRALDPALALTDIATMEQRLADSLAPQRFRATLIALLAVAALVLSAVGVYGVIARAVGGQTREIGIRLALGERSAQVRRRVMAHALRLAALGAAIGTALAFIAGRWLSSFLIDVRTFDPLTVLAMSGLLLGVAALAADRPARQASRISPLQSMRVE